MNDIPTAAPGVTDPNHTAWDVVANTPYEPGNQGGKTKIVPTDMSGESGTKQTVPFNNVNPAEVMIQGEAPSGENSSGIPAAQPIAVQTYGDPNNSMGGDMPSR